MKDINELIEQQKDKFDRSIDREIWKLFFSQEKVYILSKEHDAENKTFTPAVASKKNKDNKDETHIFVYTDKKMAEDFANKSLKDEKSSVVELDQQSLEKILLDFSMKGIQKIVINQSESGYIAKLSDLLIIKRELYAKQILKSVDLHKFFRDYREDKLEFKEAFDFLTNIPIYYLVFLKEDSLLTVDIEGEIVPLIFIDLEALNTYMNKHKDNLKEFKPQIAPLVNFDYYRFFSQLSTEENKHINSVYFLYDNDSIKLDLNEINNYFEEFKKAASPKKS